MKRKTNFRFLFIFILVNFLTPQGLNVYNSNKNLKQIIKINIQSLSSSLSLLFYSNKILFNFNFQRAPSSSSLSFHSYLHKGQLEFLRSHKVIQLLWNNLLQVYLHLVISSLLRSSKQITQTLSSPNSNSSPRSIFLSVLSNLP